MPPPLRSPPQAATPQANAATYQADTPQAATPQAEAATPQATTLKLRRHPQAVTPEAAAATPQAATPQTATLKLPPLKLMLPPLRPPPLKPPPFIGGRHHGASVTLASISEISSLYNLLSQCSYFFQYLQQSLLLIWWCRSVKLDHHWANIATTFEHVYHIIYIFSSNTSRWLSIASVLEQNLWRWLNIRATLRQRRVCSG